eukprot:TRINITY_DN7015_c0_g3_i3.p1 TRINITY_DN7015_c0_g3~~TRINITY_DN7015_c0_g3_i3.p1  ORF type:complete len:1283 (+),score=277.09 TRINITY_DN7015_c0_g3_i3:94-3849(+)
MTTSEAFRRETGNRIREVLESEDPFHSFSFPSCLSAEERKYIHHVSEQFGLRHDSSGKGDARFITIRRDPEKLKRRGFDANSISGDTPAPAASAPALPSSALQALQHPLIRIAAQQDNAEAIFEATPARAAEAGEIARILGCRGAARKSPADSAERGADRAGASREPAQTPLLGTRRSLPIWTLREEFLTKVRTNRVTLVLGDTGCGKSTQVPQFLLEDDSSASVVVTQPRRLSALALAHRVAQERGEDVGGAVGYSVHLDSTTSASTRLLFCTTGVFRRRLLAEPRLSSTTHLVLDELHERDKITDFLLIAVKELVEERPDLRIVLMSATLQHETFRRYFPGAAEVSVSGRTFPVQEFYLDDFAPSLHEAGHWHAMGPGFAAGGLGFGSFGTSGDEKNFKYKVLVAQESFSKTAKQPLVGKRLEEALWLHDVLQGTKGLQFDLPIVEALLTDLASKKGGSSGGGGGILVFLPGWDEIERLKRRCRDHAVLGDRSRFWILPLHSQIRLEQQREVFQKPPRGVRKLVLSTNIAEASLTVEDVEVVIDCGRAKETSYDNFLRVPTLNTSWVSRASIVQRAGRAGRVAPGTCYHVFSRRRFSLLDDFRSPEIQRSSLEDVCLHSRLLLAQRGLQEMSTAAYLAKAPDPPEEDAVRGAEALLEDIGALLPTSATSTSTSRADASSSSSVPARSISVLGCHLAVMPLSPQLAKLVIWGMLLGVGEEILTVVAGLQYREPFVALSDGGRLTSLAEANKTIRNAKRALCSQHCSDHLALLRAVEGFEAARAAGGGGAARTFCEENSLAFRQMQTLQQTVSRLRAELRQRNLWIDGHSTRNRGNVALLDAALAAGLFPNVAQVPAGSRGKLKANGGRLDAVPHPSSVFAFGEASASKGAGKGANKRSGVGASGASWICFNELSQVEDHYSVAGISPAPPSALLLLCGEKELIVRDAPASAASPALGVLDEKGEEQASVRDTEPEPNAFADWWARALPTGAQKSSSGRTAADAECAPGGVQGGSSSSTAAAAVPGTGEEDVIVSLAELGDWFAVRMGAEEADRLQALRSMLRLLLRSFCDNPRRFRAQCSAEGNQAPRMLLDLAAKVMDAGEDAGRGAEESPTSAPSTALPAAGLPTAEQRPRKGRGKGRAAGGSGRSAGSARGAGKAADFANVADVGVAGPRADAAAAAGGRGSGAGASGVFGAGPPRGRWRGRGRGSGKGSASPQDSGWAGETWWGDANAHAAWTSYYGKSSPGRSHY